jgi:hypothetical protein
MLFAGLLGIYILAELGRMATGGHLLLGFRPGESEPAFDLRALA